MHRRRSHVLLVLALFAPLPLTSSAYGQTAPTPSAPSAPAQPGATSPPPATAEPPHAPLIAPAPASADSGPSAPPTTSAPISPSRDQQDLAAQGSQRPEAGELAASGAQVFSEDWWAHARPVIDMHGYFRTRAELFHNLFLGRHNSSLNGNDPQYLWPIPLDQSYTSINGGIGQSTTANTVAQCGPATPVPTGACNDKTESGANVRLRLNPEIIISDNLRISTQIDLLDNVVLGSTPNSLASQPATSSTAVGTSSQNTSRVTTGYQSAGYNAYAPVGFFASTQGAPTAGVNSWTNSINVQRVWGEYTTPVGQVRFGRMPSQWGLGMVDNSGDGIDSDYQTNVDRIMFVTGLKSMDLYVGGMWDFVSTGPTALPGATTGNVWDVYGGQPYNTCNLCNVNEWAAFVAHRTNPELQRLSLARGEVVINGGLYTKFRNQELDVSSNTGQNSLTIDTTNTTITGNSLEPRQAWSLTPDVWVQILWKKLRFEAEGAMIWGEIGSLPGLSTDVGHPIDIREFGLATQLEYRALEDKLRLQFDFGYASGDPWANNSTTGCGSQGLNAIQPPTNCVQNEFNTYGPISTFAFHPDYRVDLIFFRNILSRIEGAYYFKPKVDYDFIRHADGEKLGGGVAGIWSRASDFVQTPGHHSDLGVELDAELYYQSKDGSLNDDLNKIGGFYAMLQYGVFFPLAGLNYLGPTPFDASLSAAQIVRLFLGIVF